MKRINSSILAVSMIITAMVLSSCEKDVFKTIDTRFITFKVDSQNSLKTKSAENATVKSVDLSTNEISMFMSVSAGINDENPWAIAPTTKSGESTIETLKTNGFDVTVVNNGTEVAGWATRVTDNYWQMINSSVSKSDYNVYNDTQRVMWPGGTKSDDAIVWGYYGIANANSGVINYSFPATRDHSDAVNMTDILVAKSYEPHEHPITDECVKLHFFHPLAKVSFEMGEGVTISRVEINKVATSGTVTYNAAADFDPFSTDAYKSAFEWSDLSNISNYSQVSNTNNDYSFYIIPQDLENTTVTVYAVEDGKEYALTTTELGTGSWESGMYYNYKFTGSLVGDIEIGFGEGNAVVVNEEYTAVYVRAAVVGNWVKSNGTIIKTWKPADADINTAGGWKLYDGFYYYMNPVYGYETIKEDLINTITAEESPVNGDKLEVKVAVQAVPYDEQKNNIPASWSEDAKNALNTLK